MYDRSTETERRVQINNRSQWGGKRRLINVKQCTRNVSTTSARAHGDRAGQGCAATRAQGRREDRKKDRKKERKKEKKDKLVLRYPSLQAPCSWPREHTKTWWLSCRDSVLDFIPHHNHYRFYPRVQAIIFVQTSKCFIII